MPAKVLLCPVLDRPLAARQGTWNSEKWGREMGMSRRSILMGASALPWLAGSLARPTFAQTTPTAPAEIPPILLVHGNGDHAALWITMLWRMETNGVPREKNVGDQFHRSPRAQ